MGLKVYVKGDGSGGTQTRDEAKAEAKFRTTNGGISSNAKISVTAIERLKVLHPNIKDMGVLLRKAVEEVKKVDDGAGDSAFQSGLTAYNVQTTNRRTSPFLASNGAWRKTSKTEARSGQLDSISGPGSRADKSITVDRIKPPEKKKVPEKYKKRIIRRKKL